MAVLKVLEKCPSHERAAQWYRARNLPLPSNCLVPGNLPLPLEKTLGPSGFTGCSDADKIERWDETYQERAKKNPVFLACRPIRVELHDPLRIQEEDWSRWYGRVPGTQNPPKICDHLCGLLEGLMARKAA